MTDTRETSPKSYATAVALCGVFGMLGIHHFYLRCWRHGIIDVAMTLVGGYLVFFTDGIGAALGIGILVVDFFHTIVIMILLLVGSYEDGAGRLVKYPGQK